MKIDKLNRLLDEGVLTQEEYDSFFDTMYVNENGQLVGIVQTKNPATHKYNLEGDLLNGDLVEFVKTKITPPYEAEDMDEVFKTYGVMVTGIADYWHWFTKDNITEYLYCYLKSFDFDSLGSTSSIGTAVNSKTIKATTGYLKR